MGMSSFGGFVLNRSAGRISRGLIGFLLLALGLALIAGPKAEPTGRLAVVLHIDGAIGPASADYLVRSLAKAKARGASIVVLRIDTPGGLDISMREMIRAIIASPVPVVAYVGPSGARAASAGTFILYASHVAVMAPGTNLGAATPVAIGGLPVPNLNDERKDRTRAPDDGRDKGKEDAERRPAAAPKSTMETKVLNDAVAYIRALAEMRERNADWAEQAVRDGASLSAREAERRKVIDYVANTVADALAKAHGRIVTVNDAKLTLDTADLRVEHLEPDWRTLLLGAITNPNVALILMMIGIYGLIFEFMHPGALAPGTVGSICLLVGLYALAALPVNYAGLALIVLGVGLMVAEAFTPSFGVLGIGGAIAFVLGATILIDTDIPGIEVSLPLVGGLAASALAFSAAVLRVAFAARRRGVSTGAEQMIGSLGVVLDWHGAGGHVLTHGERWRAVADQKLMPNDQVRVASIDGLTLKVSPAPDTARRQGGTS